jgi:hypothetical protein
MGVSTDAILFFGYDLGDPEDGGDAEVLLDAHDRAREQAGDDDLDFDEAIAVLAGQHSPRPDYGTDREAWHAWGAAVARAYAETFGDVEVVRHCSLSSPMYGLGVRVATAWRGTAVAPDLSVDVEDATVRLGRVLAALGIEVPARGPEWLLVSFREQ